MHDQQTAYEKFLPLLKFAYNNGVHSSIGKAPYDIIQGHTLPTLVMKMKKEVFATDEFVILFTNMQKRKLKSVAK